MTSEKGGATKHLSFSRDKPFLLFFDIKQCATVVSVSELLAGEVDTDTIFTCPTQQVRTYCLQQHILPCNYWKINRRSARPMLKLRNVVVSLGSTQVASYVATARTAVSFVHTI